MFLSTKQQCEWHIEIAKIKECVKEISFPTSCGGLLNADVKPYMELIQESLDKLRAAMNEAG